MSLFDVLLYPIGSPPTAAELSAVPVMLFSAWAAETGWQVTGADNYLVCLLIAKHYHSQRHTPCTSGDLSLLRQMILDYEHI